MAVGSEDDEVFDVRAVERDRPVHEIVEAHRAGRHVKADRARHAVALAIGDDFRRDLAAGAALVLAVAVVRERFGDEPIGHRAIPIAALGLKIRRVRSADERAFVPVEAEPSHPVEDPFDHLLRRSLDVGVFDPQHEHAAVPARVEPVEERRAGAADVEVAGGRGSEPDANCRHVLAIMLRVQAAAMAHNS